jgi:saccharopine dehydrogenase (NADP+, L-glutamate forming)/spermidine synthase
MKKVLVIGAGLVSRPLVSYLLGREDFEVTVADVEPGKAEAIVAGHPRGKTKPLSVEDGDALAAAVAGSNLVVSMVPAFMHPRVARACVDKGVPLVTASYVSPAMRELDAAAREKGVILLNELGLDPGIDHMEAMRVIHQVHKVRGRIRSFISYCGGLPAAEANNNPFGYKFSWSPRGVLAAGKNPARFLKDGREVLIPAADLFKSLETVRISGLGEFEGYPNRDSVSYRDSYGIPEAGTVLRGTLRYPGWCETMAVVDALGLLGEEPKDWKGITCRGFLGTVTGVPAGVEVEAWLEERFGLAPDSAVVARLKWLGLFEEKPLPIEKGAAIDVMTALMSEKMRYQEGERDMIVLQHEFIAEYPGDKSEKITSTLVDYGRPGGDTAMSRTVGLPVAIGARLVLERKIHQTGVRIPLDPEIYNPILEELDTLGIRFSEKIRPLQP